MSAEPKTQLTVVKVNESEANVNASQSEMADMSKFQLQLIIKRLKVRDTILTSMSQALLHMQSTDCNDKQKSAYMHLIKLQAEMVGLELPNE